MKSAGQWSKKNRLMPAARRPAGGTPRPTKVALVKEF